MSTLKEGLPKCKNLGKDGLSCTLPPGTAKAQVELMVTAGTDPTVLVVLTACSEAAWPETQRHCTGFATNGKSPAE